MTESKAKLLIEYIELAKELKKYPTLGEMAMHGVTSNRVKHHFGGIENLKKVALEYAPECFKGVRETTYHGKPVVSKQQIYKILGLKPNDKKAA